MADTVEDAYRVRNPARLKCILMLGKISSVLLSFVDSLTLARLRRDASDARDREREVHAGNSIDYAR